MWNLWEVLIIKSTNTAIPCNLHTQLEGENFYIVMTKQTVYSHERSRLNTALKEAVESIEGATDDCLPDPGTGKTPCLGANRTYS